MGNIIPFENIKDDANALAEIREMQEMFELDDSLVVSSGFPVISIKGGKWAVKQAGERTPVLDPNTGELAPAIQVVIVDYSKNVNKVFYDSKYDEDSNAPPDCYSNDGVKPAADAEKPQNISCAGCPQNAWGSTINETTGKQGKACADSRRLAVVTPDDLENPMLLRVPPTSLKYLSAYQKEMNKRGLPLPMLVTKLSFDPDSSSPLIRFKPDGFLPKAIAAQIRELKDNETVKQITGAENVPFIAEDSGPVEEIPEAVIPEQKTVKKKAAPKKKAAVKKAVKKPEPTPEPEPEVADDSDDHLFADLDSVLNT